MMGMSVRFQSVGRSVRISVGVCSFRLAITLTRLVGPLPSSLDLEQPPSNEVSDDPGGPPPLTTSLPTGHVQPPGLTSP